MNSDNRLMVDVPSAPMGEEDASPDRIDTGLIMPRRDSLMEDTMNLKDNENDFTGKPHTETLEEHEQTEPAQAQPISLSNSQEKGHESHNSLSMYNKATNQMK